MLLLKPAGKSEVVVGWSRTLYYEAANRQLSDHRFYKRLHQEKVKSTVNDMIAMYALPLSAKHLIFTFYHAAYIPILCPTEDTQD